MSRVAIALVLLAPASSFASEGKLDEHYALDSGWRAVLHKVQRRLDDAPPGAKFIYLSGPVSTGGLGSIEANLAAGNAAAKALRKAGYHVISPFEVEEDGLPSNGATKHATFMRIWSEVLADPRVTRVVLMPGAESSLGATQEIGLFQSRGGEILEFVTGAHGTGFHLSPYAYDPVLGRIEHTMLTIGATAEQIAAEARWATTSGVRAMVVRPEHAALVAKIVRGGKTVPTSVIGFPTAKFASLDQFALVSTEAKITDAKIAIDGMKRGGVAVGELDMILDVHALKAGRYAAVEQDIADVITAANSHAKTIGIKVHVKVIIETSLLTPNEIKMAAGIVRNTKALAIKTSTGFGPRGASLGDLRVINRVIAGTKLVKVSGGITPANLGKFMSRGNLFGMSRTRELIAGTGKGKAKQARAGGY